MELNNMSDEDLITLEKLYQSKLSDVQKELSKRNIKYWRVRK